MDYNNIIELDDVTLQDCMALYRIKHLHAILKDGRLTNFEKEEA